MKRALAERAKQSLSSPTQDASLPPSKLRRVATAPVSSSSEPLVNDQQRQHGMGLPEPPLMTTKPEETSELPIAPTAAVSTMSLKSPVAASPAAASTKKRPDLSISDDTNNNAFYLRHQNRALAVEWRDLNHQVQALERERAERRLHCAGAVQALQSLQASWLQLEELVLTTTTTTNSKHNGSHEAATASISSATQQGEAANVSVIPSSVASTGTGDSVEWTVALTQALSELGSSRQLPSGAPENCTSGSLVQKDRPEWSHQCASNIAARAAILRDQLQALLLRRPDQQDTAAPPPPLDALLNHSQPQIQELQSQVANLQSQLDESLASRSEAVANERKLRRNFYKLQAGLLTKEQFLNELNLDPDEDLGAWAHQQELLVEQQQQARRSQLLDEQSEHPQDNLMESLRGDNGNTATSVQVQALMAQIQDLEQKVANRDESIQTLSQQVTEKEKRVNDLSANQQSEDDRHRLEALNGAAEELESKKATVVSLESKVEDYRQQWAVALGNEHTTQLAMEEQQQKFAKKWEELSAAFLVGEQQSENGVTHSPQPEHTDMDQSASLFHAHAEAQARQIVQLQHKLTQAIENVRQAETAREDLRNALDLNESLQSKIEEMKGKLAAGHNSEHENTICQPELGNNTSNSEEATLSGNADNGGSTPSGASSAEKFEKLHREHRRMRKDFSAIMASKEAAKAKLERAEKERESLLEMNARLLKQMTEKDEMNAKSLSTILHLKSMTEQLVAERDSLEQQAKSASQLALAARLAANAKERVSEEALKERQTLADQLQSSEKQIAASKIELDRMSTECANASGKIASVNNELANALKRNNELVDEIASKNAEIRDLMDLMKKAERKANDAAEKLSVAPDASNGNTASVLSSFSVEQLNTQIGVLKSKLACPVCHYRDKECIIMRCRHLHCKHCVEERITSRNRKCPTCNNKFTEKDVADIWLNT